MILLEPIVNRAERQVDAVKTFLNAVGRAQARELDEGDEFARSESSAVSLQQQQGRNLLVILDRQVAETRRGRHRLSWVFQRLCDLIESAAEVEVLLVEQIGSLVPALGGTAPRFDTYFLHGRTSGGYFRLPGPVGRVTISALNRIPEATADRSSLQLGRTIVHELVIHAWRDISFYQPATSNDSRADVHEESVHQAQGHYPTVTRQHNLADAEADLIDLYYDRSANIGASEEERMHPGFTHVIRFLGGVMGSRIPDLIRRDRAVEEYLAERQRFVAEARAFARVTVRNQSRDRRRRQGE